MVGSLRTGARRGKGLNLALGRRLEVYPISGFFLCQSVCCS